MTDFSRKPSTRRPSAREVERAEAAGLLHRGDGGEAPLLAVEADGVGDVEVGDAVAVGQAEGLVADVVADPPQPAAGHGLEPGVGEGDAPRLGGDAVDLDGVGREVDRQVVGAVEELEEVFLDEVALVAAADHEVVQAMRRIDLHDVPEHRHRADFHQRLGDDSGLLAQARSVAAGKDNDLHGNSTRKRSTGRSTSRLTLGFLADCGGNWSRKIFHSLNRSSAWMGRGCSRPAALTKLGDRGGPGAARPLPRRAFRGTTRANSSAPAYPGSVWRLP